MLGLVADTVEVLLGRGRPNLRFVDGGDEFGKRSLVQPHLPKKPVAVSLDCRDQTRVADPVLLEVLDLLVERADDLLRADARAAERRGVVEYLPDLCARRLLAGFQLRENLRDALAGLDVALLHQEVA